MLSKKVASIKEAIKEAAKAFREQENMKLGGDWGYRKRRMKK